MRDTFSKLQIFDTIITPSTEIKLIFTTIDNQTIIVIALLFRQISHN
jgi:hypothetical protein